MERFLIPSVIMRRGEGFRVVLWAGEMPWGSGVGSVAIVSTPFS